MYILEYILLDMSYKNLAMYYVDKAIKNISDNPLFYKEKGNLIYISNIKVRCYWNKPFLKNQKKHNKLLIVLIKPWVFKWIIKLAANAL